MRRREEIRKGHEKAVADQLLDALRINADFERLGDPDKKEPDVICRQGDRILGIEVATAYYGDRDAKDEWEIAAGENPLSPEEIRPGSVGIMVGPDNMICNRIQRELEDKCAKEYTGSDETWLCINISAALSDAESVAQCAKELKLPRAHRFARIYLTYTAPEHEGGKYTAVGLAG